MDDPNYSRHLVSGSCTLPDGFFNGGYEHIRDGYPHVYANGFHLSYLKDDANEYYFDFEFYLADETMQELGYVDLGPDSWYADHYMIGKPVGVIGFTLRYDGTQWRVREADALVMDYQDETGPIDDTAADPSPEPSPTTSAAPTACEHGLDNAISGWSNGYLVLTCELDGAAYPVPAVTQGSWEPGISEDFDGDGHVEHAFFQNGLMMIVDWEAGQLVTSAFDPSSTFAAFDQGRTWEMAEDYTALTVSYLGRTVQVPLYISGGTSYPDVAIAHPFTPETIYPYTGYIFRGGHFDMSSPVALGKVYSDRVSLYAHWSVRYTGGGFQVLSDSFQFELVPQ